MSAANARCSRFLIPWLAAIVALAAPAAGQGTRDLLPGAISARHLSRYAERLMLSDDQRLAIEIFHDEYILEFEELRQRQIDPFLEEFASMRMGFAYLLDRQKVDNAVRRLDQITGRVRDLDRRLFDAVQTVLTEGQLVELQAVREARQRARAGSGLVRFGTFMNPAARIDLTDLTEDLDLTPQDRQAARPMIRQYERDLTAATAKLADYAGNLPRNLYRQLEAQGLDDQMISNPSQRGRVMGAMRTAWGELSSRLLEQTRQISDLNRRAVADLQRVLPAEPAHELRTTFYQRGYDKAGAGIASNPAERWFDTALALDDLDDELRQTITLMRRGYWLDTDRLTDRGADLIDRNRQDQRLFARRDRVSRDAFDEAVADLRRRRQQVNTGAIDGLRAALPPEQVARLQGRLAGRDEPAEPAKTTGVIVSADAGGAGGGAVATVEIQPVQPAAPPDSGLEPYLPGPITGREMNRFAGWLGLDETSREILATMHADYVESFHRLDDTAIQAAREARQALWSWDGRSGRIDPPTDADVDRLYRLRRQALESITALDGEMLDNMEALTDEVTAMERVRLARQRDIYRRGKLDERSLGSRHQLRSVVPGAELSEASVNLAQVLEDHPWPTEVGDAVPPILLGYERQLTQMMRQRYELSLSLAQALERMSLTRGGDSPRPIQSSPGFRQLARSDGRAVRDTERRIVQLNRDTVQALADALPADEADAVQRLYGRASFADVYHDPISVLPVLDSALELTDLTFEQRSALAELSAEHRPRYDALCREMVELRAADAMETQRDWQTRMDRRRTLERLRAQRDDLSEKLRVRLRALLTPEQSRHVGLAEPEDSG